MKTEIIAATLVHVRNPNARICTECQRPVLGMVLRVAEKRDGIVSVYHYCPYIDREDEIRGCAPEHPKVRAALSRKVRA